MTNVQFSADGVIIEPKWPIVGQARPTIIKPQKVRRAPKGNGEWKTAVLLPDPQIGFRVYENGSRDTFHDESAIDVALQLVSYVNQKRGVDQVIWLGDFLDLPGQGKYIGEPSFAQTTQLSIDYGHSLLAKVKATAPDAQQVLIEGNHDKRLTYSIQVNAGASMGVKRANLPNSWPVMSLPHLLRLDELGVEYIDAWPNGRHWINPNLFARHGDKVRSGGSTANAYVAGMPHISQVFGHIHRIEMHYRTTFDFEGPKRSVAFSPGCLCRIDGAVPSYGSSIKVDGTPAERWEDWQQGIGIVDYHEDGRFSITPVHILDGWAYYDGREFHASGNKAAA